MENFERVEKPEKDLKCGLLGRKLGHSFSPQIHASCAEYGYKLFEVEPENADGFIRNGDYDCINVTIPYKENAYRMCDVLSEAAAEMKSVNTIVRAKDGKIHGFNTDFKGFTEMLKKAGCDANGKECVVLGSGGASKTCVYALKKLNAGSVTVVSRSGDVNYENIYDVCENAQIVINATPVGMYPNVDDSPVALSKFKKLEFAGDLIYNPSVTRFIAEAKELGVK